MQKQEMYLSAIRQNDNINNNISAVFRDNKKRYIYGSGLPGRQYVLGIFQRYENCIAGVIFATGGSFYQD